MWLQTIREWINKPTNEKLGYINVLFKKNAPASARVTIKLNLPKQMFMEKHVTLFRQLEKLT